MFLEIGHKVGNKRGLLNYMRLKLCFGNSCMQLLLLHDDVSRHELCLFTPTKTPDSHPDKCYQHVTHNHFKAKFFYFFYLQRTNSISPKERPKSEAAATSEAAANAAATTNTNGRRASSPIINVEAKKLKKEEVRLLLIDSLPKLVCLLPSMLIAEQVCHHRHFIVY